MLICIATSWRLLLLPTTKDTYPRYTCNNTITSKEDISSSLNFWNRQHPMSLYIAAKYLPLQIAVIEFLLFGLVLERPFHHLSISSGHTDALEPIRHPLVRSRHPKPKRRTSFMKRLSVLSSTSVCVRIAEVRAKGGLPGFEGNGSRDNPVRLQ